MAKTDSSPPPAAAKPAAKSAAAKPAPKPAPRPAASPPSAGVMAGYRVLKLAGIVAGFPASMLCLMALIGGVTENGYARFLGALLVTLAVPLFVADRLLPDHDPTRARGLVTDVLAVTWVLTSFLVAGAFGSSTRGALTREGDRLVRAGYTDFARGAYFLAGVKASIPAPQPEPAASGSAAASASAPAAIADAGAVEDAAATVLEPRDAGKPVVGRPERSPAELFKDLAPSVVTITVKTPRGEGGGTGFLVDKDGTVATNHHVIADAGAVRVKFENGATYEDVELLVDSPVADLALLHLNLAAPVEGGTKPDVGPLTLGDSDAIIVGEHAISIGNPLGLDHTLTDGLVSSRRIYEDKQWIQFSAPISPGNSGGPLFNMRGEVIGISTATLTGYGVAQNLNLAVPINELKKLFSPTYPARRKFGSGAGPSKW